MALQIRRGLEADRSGVTPAEGELIYTTDEKKVYIGDGTTAGGVEFALSSALANVVEDLTPQLGGNLDLNGNNIVGTGSINISGTITASGNINLGDGAGGDIISVGGDVNGGLVPTDDGSFDIGSSSARWNTGHFNSLNVSGQLDAATINANLVADDSSVVFNKATGVITADITGSIFAQDSTMLVNALDGNIPASVINGTLTNNLTGNVTGDVKGSVYADDSTQIIDGLTGIVNTTQANVTTLETNVLNDRDDSGILTVNLNNTGGNVQPRIILESNGTAGSGLWITTNDTSRTLAGTDNIGRVLFRSIDAGGTETPAVMIARKDEFVISVGAKGDAETTMFDVATGNVGIGIAATSTEKLNVGGDANIVGRTTTDLIGSVYSSDSTQIIDAETGRIVNLAFTGEVGNTPADTGTVDSWLEVTVNGNTKYIPLYA